MTPEEKANRRKYIGASDANIIMHGTDESLYNLWLEKIGKSDGPDLSDVIPVQLGKITENLNAHIYEKKTGRKVIHRQNHQVSSEYDFMAATLDGLCLDENGDLVVFESKFRCGEPDHAEAMIAKYYPQLTHQMIVTGARKASLSVITGRGKWYYRDVPFDAESAEKLLFAEREFWACVQLQEAPNNWQPNVIAPKAEWRDYDYSLSNEWRYQEEAWLQTFDGYKAHQDAAEQLRAMVPMDAGLVIGNVLQAKRNSRGAITITQKKEESNGK